MDIINKKFNRLLVTSKSDKKNHFNCTCDCGKTCVVMKGNLISNGTKSCGCLVSERMIVFNKSNAKHGKWRTPEYTAWINMKTRCTNESSDRSKDYHGRGISVSKNWVNSFENFYQDMGQKPTPAHSLDRINNNCGYEKENCHWATNKEQSKNRRSNRIIEYLGSKDCLSVIVKKYSKLQSDVVRQRLNRGWSIEEALLTPKIKRGI